MKLITFMNVVIFTLTSTVTAIPSYFGDKPGVSLRDARAPPVGLLGPNCLGQDQCNGGYCNVNLKTLKMFVDQIDDATQFSSFQQIACLRCATEAERPADYKHGVCAYARDLAGTVSAKSVKATVNELIAHGCAKCGASPIDSNDVANGQLKVDFTRGACETGVCKRVAPGSDDAKAGTAIATPDIPSRDAPPPDAANPLLGTDCNWL